MTNCLTSADTWFCNKRIDGSVQQGKQKLVGVDSEQGKTAKREDGSWLPLRSKEIEKMSKERAATLDGEVARDVIRLYMEEHPLVSQAEVARRLGADPSALSRFLRVNKVHPKAEWEYHIKKLGEDIDYWGYVERTTKVREFLNEQQQRTVNAEFVSALCRKFSIMEVVPETIKKRNPSFPYYLTHPEGGADLSIVNPTDRHETWNFIYCRGKVRIENGDFLRFTMFTPSSEKAHLVLVTRNEDTFEDTMAFMRIGKTYGGGIVSGSVLLLHDGEIVREYTHGDLALYRLSSATPTDNGNSKSSIVPPVK